MYIFRLNDEYSNENGLKYLQQFNSTKSLFYSAIHTTTEEKTQEEIEKLVESGKVAVFPIYEKMGIDNIIGHIKMGFIIYFMSYSVFREFRENYINDFINSSETIEEETQSELPL